MRVKRVRVQPRKFHQRPGVLVQTPYDVGFIEQLKAMVPYTDRWFDERKAGWWISDQYSDVIIHLARECFGGAEVKDAQGETVIHGAGGERCRQESLL